MKRPTFLSRPILISLFGHIAVFNIFVFSFGQNIPASGNAPVIFWGQYSKSNPDIQLQAPNISVTSVTRRGFDTKPALPEDTTAPFLCRDYVKPHSAAPILAEKGAFISEQKSVFAPGVRKVPVILFHPFLPYSFSLYFRDRQVAHVELMFKISPKWMGSSIQVERKVSSGNLEVDLLSMRYINRYLFMQQHNIPADKWQSVKIDLSSKGD